LPSGAAISVAGILRSEAEAYLATQFKRFVNEPAVTATPYIRVSIFGGVTRPGFYYVPANTLLSDAIMSDSFANGPANNVRWKKSAIMRQDQVVVDGNEFSDAIYGGRTLDQLNVQAGDEIRVDVRPPTALFWRIVAASSGLIGLVYLATRIF
jgi:protein involved in polysaccharide export with SLBB domain